MRVTGILFPSEKGGPAPAPAGTGIVQTPRIDLFRLGPGFGFPLYPAYVQLTAQSPRQSGDYPIALPLPQLDNGPHLSYAIKWFSFTAIGLIGWPLLLRRSRRDREPVRTPDRNPERGPAPTSNVASVASHDADASATSRFDALDTESSEWKAPGCASGTWTAD